MEKLAEYKNGNHVTTLYEDGTKTWKTINPDDTSFTFDFAENIDIKITDKCSRGCAFCFEGSSRDGISGDIMHEHFFDTLHPGQEVALGGGNVLEHEDFVPLLKKLSADKVVCNATFNVIHFLKNMKLISRLNSEGLLHGIGISIPNLKKSESDVICDYLVRNRDYVVHTIAGITTMDTYRLLSGKGLKVLVLGYKSLKRGKTYSEMHSISVDKNIVELSKSVKKMIDEGWYEVMSFDNLALRQLGIKDKVNSNEWDKRYMGEDGTSTFFIDAVRQEFAKMSTMPQKLRMKIEDSMSVDDMFKEIKEGHHGRIS